MCTEECGRLDPPAELELVRAFEIMVLDAFAFLGPAHRMRPSSLATFGLDGSSRRPLPAAELSYPFVAVLEFTADDTAVRLSYGERGYHLDLEIASAGSGYHPLASWLDALGIDVEAADDSGVATPTAIARHGRALARGLRDHLGAIRGAGPGVVGRLGSLGARTPARLNRTRDRAHAAFAAGEYGTYVELLDPFENALTVTERRKLDFARSKRPAA